MSTTNLLQTSTVNFQELLGNGRTYAVPAYQRDYSWTEDQWDELWEDLSGVRHSPKERHYMGAVVVKAETDRQFLVIDGQQRIATLTILGLAVIKHLEALGGEENKERAKQLRDRYIGEKDPASLTERSKVTLNEHDNGFFQDYLIQLRDPINPKSLPKSSKLLYECFRYFQHRINEDKKISTDGLALAELLSEVVARRLMFILITVDDEVSAYTVFETLNARGLELTTSDLLKNYLFSRLQAKADLEAVQRRWQRLVSTVRQDRFGDFLRYHYLTTNRTIRSGQLYKLVRDKVRSSKEVIDLMIELEGRAELFDALNDYNHSYWGDRPGQKPYVRQLNLFRVKQTTPLFFAVLEKFTNHEADKTFKLIVATMFRHTVIGARNTNELEPVFSQTAAKILSGEATTARHVFEAIRSIYVNDAQFVIDFSEKVISTNGQRKKVAKYVLCNVEAHLAAKPCDFETDAATIEHILPENLPSEWEDAFGVKESYDAIYRLGNLTLLEASINRDVDDKLYPEKVKEYPRSQYELTKRLAADYPEEWTLAHLEERQRALAEIAKVIWRSDFV